MTRSDHRIAFFATLVVCLVLAAVIAAVMLREGAGFWAGAMLALVVGRLFALIRV
jgi:hypothetical protein